MTSRAATPTHPERNLEAGHAAHTKEADTIGLSGQMPRPIKLAFLGAGSHFTLPLATDLIRIPSNCGGEIALVDIDSHRLRLSLETLKKLLQEMKADQWTVTATTDRRQALHGSSYVVNCVEVNGVECVDSDYDIPARYGIRQCIGDTIGPGGIFKALRTIPEWIGILQDCERICPTALVLNYTNPMNMLCLAAARSSSMNVVGLCHSVQGTSHLLAEYSEIHYNELEWSCYGINHLAWFTRLTHRGEDLYPRLKKRFQHEIEHGREECNSLASDGDLSALQQQDLIRKDMCLHFGAFITESSGHLSEYLPYYRKSRDGRSLLRSGYHGEDRFYASNWPEWRQRQDSEREEILSGKRALEPYRSWEYASWIIEAIEKNSPFRIHGNVSNNNGQGGSLIPNLPADGCVEVPCLVDGNGVQATRCNALPAQMAGLCSSNMYAFELGTQAALERSKEKTIHALLLDPLCAAVCTPNEIRAMTLEMFEQQADYLPNFS